MTFHTHFTFIPSSDLSSSSKSSRLTTGPPEDNFQPLFFHPFIQLVMPDDNKQQTFLSKNEKVYIYGKLMCVKILIFIPIIITILQVHFLGCFIVIICSINLWTLLFKYRAR